MAQAAREETFDGTGGLKIFFTLMAAAKESSGPLIVI